MINLFSNVKRTLAASLISVAIAVAGAAPAAANDVSFSFSFGSNQVGQESFSPPPTYAPRNCMNNRRIIAGLGNQGYYNVQFVGESYSGYPEFQAVYGSWYYFVQVDRCSGQLFNVQQVRPVVYRSAPPPTQWWPAPEPRPFGGNSDILYHRN